MDQHDIAAYLLRSFEGVETATNAGYVFFFYGAERMLPFATLATADDGCAS